MSWAFPALLRLQIVLFLPQPFISALLTQSKQLSHVLALLSVVWISCHPSKVLCQACGVEQQGIEYVPTQVCAHEYMYTHTHVQLITIYYFPSLFGPWASHSFSLSPSFISCKVRVEFSSETIIVVVVYN